MAHNLSKNQALVLAVLAANRYRKCTAAQIHTAIEDVMGQPFFGRLSMGHVKTALEDMVDSAHVYAQEDSQGRRLYRINNANFGVFAIKDPEPAGVWEPTKKADRQ